MKGRFALMSCELSRRGRAQTTYALRAVVAFAGTALAVVSWLVVSESAGNTVSAAQNLASTMVAGTSLFQLGVVMFLAPAFAAQLFAEDRAAGVLPLLRLADFSSISLFLSKYSVAVLQALFMMAATLPLIAAASFFGGVNVPSAMMRAFVLSVGVLASCAVTLWCSLQTRSSRIALVTGMGLFALWFLLTLLLDAYLWRHGLDWRFNLFNGARWPAAPRQWVPAVAAHLGLACFASLAIIRQLTRMDAGPKGKLETRRRVRSPWGKGFMRMDHMAQILAANADEGFWASLSPFTTGALVVLLAGLACIPVFGWVMATLLICFDATLSLWLARRCGLMADVLLTPLPEARLSRSVFLANVNRTLFLMPMAIISEYSCVLALVNWRGGEEPFSVLFLLFVAPLFSGLARYFCCLALACRYGAGYGAPLASGARCAVYLTAVAVLLYTPLWMGAHWPLELPEGLALDLLVGAYSLVPALTFAAIGRLAYSRLPDTLWGRKRMSFASLKGTGGI